MTAETVFKFSRAYRLFYQGKYDFKKYKGAMKMPALISQPDRVYYHKLAGKLTDAQIHAMFLVGFFFNPVAHVSTLMTPQALTSALAFASRAENGRVILEHDLYALSKVLADKDIDTWLYGDYVGSYRTAIPECAQMTLSGELPLDLAAMLLLIPQPELDYHWAQTMTTQDEIGLGMSPWIQRLKCLDQLLVVQRPGWRMLAYDLAKQFWQSMKYPTLGPKSSGNSAALFG